MADVINFNGGAKTTTEDNKLPVNKYAITTMVADPTDGTGVLFAEGFCVFTSHHIAIMRDFGASPVPVLVVPLTNVFSSEIIQDDEEQDDLPF